MEASMGEMAAGGKDAGRKPVFTGGMGEALGPKVREIARRLGDARRSGRFVLLRFHHDADGISGALAISEAVRVHANQQNSAAYSVKDAVRDLGTLANEDKPIALLLDFGMNAESAEGLKLLKAAGVEVLIIDHHPPSGDARGVADFCLSPWEFSQEPDTSGYVAGALAAWVAMEMGVQGAERYAGIACAGDKSGMLETGERERKLALVLDYMAAHTGYGNNLRLYRSVLEKEELLESVWQQADEKIENAAQAARRGLKRSNVGGANGAGGIVVVSFSLKGIVTDGEFPNRSKVTTRVFEELCREMHEGPLLVLGLGEKTVILRANDAAVAKGANAGALAGKVKESMRDFVLAGGGHGRAAAVRVKEGFAGAVAEEIVRALSG